MFTIYFYFQTMRSYVVVAIFVAVLLAQESLGKSISQQGKQSMEKYIW